MNQYTCNITFTSPHTGRTYLAGTTINQFEYDRLSYSDSQRFKFKQGDESFAFQASNSSFEQTDLDY